MHHSRTRRVRRAAAAFLTAATAAVAPATATAVVAPAAAPADAWHVATAPTAQGADRPGFRYALDPGATVEDGLTVVNDGATPLELDVYGADGFTTAEGAFDLRTRDHAAVGVGAWLHADEDHLTLAPGESAAVPFTVALPGDAAPGDHVGGIVTSATGADGVEHRQALRVQVVVAGAAEPGLAVERVRVRDTGGLLGRGDATVTYVLHNTGATVLSSEQTVTVTGPFGAFAASVGPVAVPELLPGERWTASVTVPDVVASGRLTTTVSAVPVWTDPAGSTGSLAATSATAHGWATPWPVLAVLVMIAAAVVLLGRRRARGQARHHVSR